ncbi:MAG: hypothetical protein L0271_06350 [Gemmatimonadetes bacterium]|nr:hypothetical protein [Gemmatimonadota bacterium]
MTDPRSGPLGGTGSAPLVTVIGTCHPQRDCASRSLLLDVATPGGDPGPIGADADALAGELQTECRLLRELRLVLSRQRDAVARDDCDLIDESVVAAHRILDTLAEAWRLRRTLVDRLTATDDVALDDLPVAYTHCMTPHLAIALGRLRGETRRMARSVRLSQHVLDVARARLAARGAA